VRCGRIEEVKEGVQCVMEAGTQHSKSSMAVHPLGSSAVSPDDRPTSPPIS
jgi:hypothetical protein